MNAKCLPGSMSVLSFQRGKKLGNDSNDLNDDPLMQCVGATSDSGCAVTAALCVSSLEIFAVSAACRSTKYGAKL